MKFSKFGLDNIVDLKKCCKMGIFLQRSVPIPPKTRNILPKFWCIPRPDRLPRADGALLPRLLPRRDDGPGRNPGQRHLAVRSAGGLAKLANLTANFVILLQIFGGLVLGCIKATFCNKICVWQHFSSSTRFASFCTAAISKFADFSHFFLAKISRLIFLEFLQNFAN